ncbi:hypothetical protein EIN_381070 [Entamoeba invadens IP1]|uniref:Uncharacterized protein n=1 Tax=Entamoeba invadens IP1 TaxID=370355 RepID=A0A0A1UAY2_ENTIV|nr:hypothetical protein EIN_381070 [Entamoeba invadens IP1]ELP92150.1 hypothetical protein EIN_381070 [Entamoeba invadens IP1]|eukprot:XP_004258921.1 hypothetical protein EIN_381070 [Entamoeba invadens IP1]
MEYSFLLQFFVALIVVVSFIFVIFLVFTFHYLERVLMNLVSFMIILVCALVTCFLIVLNTFEYSVNYPLLPATDHLNLSSIIIGIIFTGVYCVVVPFSVIILNDKHAVINAISVTLQITAFSVLVFILAPIVITMEVENNDGFSIESIFVNLDPTAQISLNKLYVKDDNNVIEWLISGTCAIFICLVFCGRVILVYYGGYGTASTGIEMIRGTIFSEMSPYQRNEKLYLSDYLNAPQHSTTQFKEYTKLKLELYQKKYDALHLPKTRAYIVMMIFRIIFGVLAILSSATYVVCIIVSLYGDILYSQCGWKCGFIPQTSGKILPFEKMLDVINGDNLFVLRFIILLLLNMYSAFTVFLGARQLFTRYPGVSKFVLKARKTLPGSVVLIASFICLSSVGFVMQIISIMPNVLMYGSQLDSSGMRCTMMSIGPCEPTGVSKMLFKIIATIPYVGLVIYLSNIFYFFTTILHVIEEVVLLTKTLFTKTEKLLKAN